MYEFWERYRSCFCTRTRDTSENAYVYWRGQLTMEEARNFTNIERRLQGRDGQALQQFMWDSPGEGQGVFRQIQAEIAAHPLLQHGGWRFWTKARTKKRATTVREPGGNTTVGWAKRK